MFAVDPRRTSTAEWADSWLGLERRHRHPAGPRDRPARSSTPGLHNTAFIERATTGFEEYAAVVEPWTLAAAEKVTGVPADADPRARPRLRPRRARPAVLDARHHRAPQRHRQRPRADQPVAAHRARRALRLGPQARCAGRTTCRAAATWAPSPTACPASRTSSTRRHAAKFEPAWETRDPAALRAEPHRDVRGDGRRAS